MWDFGLTLRMCDSVGAWNLLMIHKSIIFRSQEVKKLGCKFLAISPIPFFLGDGFGNDQF